MSLNVKETDPVPVGSTPSVYVPVADNTGADRRLLDPMQVFVASTALCGSIRESVQDENVPLPIWTPTRCPALTSNTTSPICPLVLIPTLVVSPIAMRDVKPTSAATWLPKGMKKSSLLTAVPDIVDTDMWPELVAAGTVVDMAVVPVTELLL